MSEQLPANTLQVSTGSRQILRIALPISLALLVPQINFLINNVFVSGLGEQELGTAGITGVVYLIFALAGNGLNNGLQGLMSRRAGENRPGEIGKLFAQGLWIALFFALTAILLTLLAGPLLLQTSLRSDQVYQEAMSFLRIRVWGIPFLYAFQISNAFLVATNNTRYMKYGFWIQALANIALDYGLIYGHWGLPVMGFNGAALASVLSECLGLTVVMSIIFYKKFHRQFSLFLHQRYDKVLSGLIFRQSSPLVAQYMLSILSWVMFYIFIEHHGKRPLAISNSMRNIFGIFGVFAWAFASTSNAMVSNIIGQGLYEKVFPLIRRIAWLSAGFTALLCALVNLFPGLFLSIYHQDPGFVSEAVPVIRIVTAGVLCMSVSTVWLSAVTGTGNTAMNLRIELICIVLYSVYVYLVVQYWNLGLKWAWTAEMVYWTSLLAGSYFYLRTGRWRDKKI